jgi:hypothetical protein
VNFAGTCSGFDIISSCIVDLPIWITPKSSEVLFIERYGNFDMDDSLITFEAFASRVIFAFVIVTFASLGKTLIVIVIEFCFGMIPLVGSNMKQSEEVIVNRIDTFDVFVSLRVLVVSFKVGMKLKSIDGGMLVNMSL